MKFQLKTVPSRYQEEYLMIQKALFKKRINLNCSLAAGLFLIVCIQYYVRHIFLHQQTFNPSEIWIWVALVLVTGTCLVLNQMASRIEQHRLIAHIFNFFFIMKLGALALIYTGTATVFSFYYAFSLLITSFMMPWRLRDFTLLTGITIAVFSFYYFYVSIALARPITNFPRFHAYWDGLIFIGLAYVIGFVIKKNDTQRDIDNFILLKEIAEKNKQIQNELELANLVHQTLIPESIQTDLAEVAVTYIPVGSVGGDYARFRFADETKLIVFISDVTGHGVPAALLVNRLHAEFERLARDTKSPGALMGELNAFILRDFSGTQMYMSAFCGILDFSENKFRYSSYGHPTQYHYRYRREEILGMNSLSGLLGIDTDENPAEHEIGFERGDGVFLYTDGVIETQDASGREFGASRVQTLIRELGERPAEEMNRRIMDEIRAFSNNQFQDDIFILNIKTKR